jgi:hypothetical protein
MPGIDSSPVAGREMAVVMGIVPRHALLYSRRGQGPGVAVI